MASQIGEIASGVDDAQAVLSQYQDIVTDLQGQVVKVREGLPTWLRWIRIGLSLTLLWLGIAQIGLISQGWELIVHSRSVASSSLPVESSGESQ
jgi:hypothetical protein